MPEPGYGGAIKTRNHFIDEAGREQLTAAEGGMFSHETRIGSKDTSGAKAESAKGSSRWFVKAMVNPYTVDPSRPISEQSIQFMPRTAEAEVVGQEYSRLMWKHNPKTRVVVDGEKIYVASKEIPGAKEIVTYSDDPQVVSRAGGKFRGELMAGQYHGLGENAIIALVTQESDFKPGNMRLDGDNNFCKFDGDWMFANQRFESDHPGRTSDPVHQRVYGFDISAKDLPNFPNLSDSSAYRPNSWLESRHQGISNTNPHDFFDENYNAQHPKFQREMHRGILKSAVLTDEFVEKIAQAHCEAEDFASNLAGELNNNRQNLLDEALETKEFRDYLNSDAALEDLASFKEDLLAFDTYGSNLLIDQVGELLFEDMDEDDEFGAGDEAEYDDELEQESRTSVTLTEAEQASSPARRAAMSAINEKFNGIRDTIDFYDEAEVNLEAAQIPASQPAAGTTYENSQQPSSRWGKSADNYGSIDSQAVDQTQLLLAQHAEYQRQYASATAHESPSAEATADQQQGMGR